jgi:nucleotide-binding universal stress UspA family protein
MQQFKRIVVGTDGSGHAEVAVQKAFSLADLLKTPVVAVYVVDPVHFQGFPPDSVVADMTKILREEADRVMGEVRQRAEAAGIKLQTMVREGRPAEELCTVAKADDLIVVATHGRRGLGRILLGSVAENVVRHAPCPVLVVRDPAAARPRPKRAAKKAAG